MNHSLGRPWTSAEDDAIRARYVTAGSKPLAWDLARTVSSINHRAKRIGVLRARRWTATEDARLHIEWSELSPKELVLAFGRTWAAIYWRAGTLGLPRGCSDGFERLGDAAKRTGFCRESLRAILRWAGVRIHRTKARSAMDRGQCFTLSEVIPFDVDVAVAKWMATEVVASAAKARGLVDETLRNWLREAARMGVSVPREPRRKKARWRVPTVLIDQVVAKHASTASMRAHAMRLGVPVHRLRCWLYDAGVERTATKVWRLPAAVVDEVVAARTGRRAA